MIWFHILPAIAKTFCVMLDGNISSWLVISMFGMTESFEISFFLVKLYIFSILSSAISVYFDLQCSKRKTRLFIWSDKRLIGPSLDQDFDKISPVFSLRNKSFNHFYILVAKLLRCSLSATLVEFQIYMQ